MTPAPTPTPTAITPSPFPAAAETAQSSSASFRRQAKRGWQSTNANTISVNVPDDSQESQDLTGTNFGLLQVGAVAGTIFNDSNNNGAQDYGESGLSYCLVYYDPTGQGYYNWNDPQATTASDGSYQLQNVPDSGGAVFVQAPSGWQQTAPANGAGAAISFSNPVNFGAYDAAEYDAASQRPTGLAATAIANANTPSSDEIDLTWSNNSGNDPTVIVQQSTDGGATFYTLATLPGADILSGHRSPTGGELCLSGASINPATRRRSPPRRRRRRQPGPRRWRQAILPRPIAMAIR